MTRLSETDLERLEHAPDKLKDLRKLGYRDDAEELLWSLIVEERHLSLDRTSLKHFVAGLQERDEAQCWALFRVLLENGISDLPNHYGYSYNYEFDRHISTYLEHLLRRYPEALHDRHQSLPAPYDALAAIVLATANKLERFAPTLLPGVARWLLGIEGRWYLRYLVQSLPAHRIPALVDEAQWHATCLALATSHVVDWEAFPKAALADATDQELIELSMQQPTVYDQALTREARKRGKRLLSLLDETYQPENPDAEPKLITPAMLLGWLELLDKHRRPFPPKLLEYTEACLADYGTSGQKIDMLRRAFARLPPADAKTIIMRYAPEADDIAMIFSAVQDDDIFAEMLDVLRTTEANNSGSWSQDHFVEGFAAGGKRALPAIEAALADDSSARIATLLSKSLVQMGTLPESLPLLGSLLGHRSKRVRETAAEGLAQRAEEAMPTLEESLLASTKKEREAALSALHQTQPSAARDALLDAVAARSKHKAIVDALARLPRHQQADSDGSESNNTSLSRLHQVKQLFEQGPTSSTPPHLRDLLDADPYDLEAWADEFAPHSAEPLAPWIAVYQVSREEWLTHIESVPEVMAAVERMATYLGTTLVEPLCELSLYEYGQEVLLPLLAKLDPDKALPVILEGIEQAKGKGLYAQIQPLRRAAIDALPLVGPIAIPPLIELLSARKKDLRQAAAEVISRLAPQLAEGSPKSTSSTSLADDLEAAIVALEAAFEKEKVAVVKKTISKALMALQTTTQLSGEPPETLDASALDDYLTSLPLIPLPDFLDLRQLPPLQLAGGHTLSRDAVWGWLSLLSHHSPEQPNATAVALRDRFSRPSLCDFGAHLLDEWRDNSSSNTQRWMQFQRSITASTSWLLHHSDWLVETELLFFIHHGSRLGRLCVHYQIDNDEYGTFTNSRALAQFTEALHMPPMMRAHFAMECEDRDINNYELSPDGRGLHDDVSDVSLPVRLYPTAIPTLGAPLPELALRLDTESFNEETHTEDQLRGARVFCQKVEGQIRHTTRQLTTRLQDAASSGRAWTRAGWEDLFTQHPLWSMLGRGIVFCDDRGQRFLRSPQGDAIGPDGEALSLDDDAMISPWLIDPEGRVIGRPHGDVSDAAQADVAQISQADAEAWQALLDAWYGQDQSALAPAAADPLFAVRDLLYASPNHDGWEALKAVLESWPQDGSVDVALSYIDAHIGTWGALVRPTPLRWSAHLLDWDNERRDQLLDGNKETDDYPLLQACNHLVFESADIKYGDAWNITQSDYLHNIKHLEFRWGRIFKGADTQLAKHAAFPALQRLTLHNVTIRKLGWRLLFGAPWVRQCKHLSLRHMQLDWSRLEAIIEAGALEHVEVLDLRDNSIGMPGVKVLCEAGPFPHLKDLQLNILDLGIQGYEELCQSDRFQSLESLTLVLPGYWYRAPYSPANLAQSPHFPRLKKLFLWDEHTSHYGVQDEWAHAIVESTHLPEAAREFVKAAGTSSDFF